MRNEKIEKKNEKERERRSKRKREKLSSWFNASYEQSLACDNIICGIGRRWWWLLIIFLSVYLLGSPCPSNHLLVSIFNKVYLGKLTANSEQWRRHSCLLMGFIWHFMAIEWHIKHWNWCVYFSLSVSLFFQQRVLSVFMALKKPSRCDLYGVATAAN